MVDGFNKFEIQLYLVYITIMDNSPLVHMDFDVSRYLYEEYYPQDNPDNKKSGSNYSSYKSKYKKKKKTGGLSDETWSGRNNDVLYDLS